MPWFKRYYGPDTYQTDFDRFDKMFTTLGGPRGMLMASTGSAAETTVYIRLHDPLLAASFPGFEALSSPPTDVQTGLIGHEDELREARKNEPI
jgi:hypothetical protein